MKYPVIYIITKLELGGAQKVCLTLFNNLNTQIPTYSPQNLIPGTSFTPWLISGAQGTLVKSVKNNSHVLLLATLKREFKFSNFTSICTDIRAFWDMITQLRALKQKFPQLIVHTHSTKAGYLGRWAAFFAGIKIRIHTVHGWGFHSHQSWPLYLLSYFLEFCTSFITTHYVTVSQADITLGIKKIPFFLKKQTLIRAAISPEFTQNLAHMTVQKFTQNKFIFGTVACFKPQKNIFDVLHAFKVTRDCLNLYKTPITCCLEIIGDGELRPEIETWITENNLQNVIILHGWQDHVAPIMKNWNCFVLTSLWEGLPCAIIEARCLKLPVITYAVGGISDVIKHDQNGFLCAPHQIKTFAHYMFSLVTNQALYQRLSNYHDNLEDFTQEAMLEQHRTLYKNISTTNNLL